MSDNDELFKEFKDKPFLMSVYDENLNEKINNSQLQISKVFSANAIQDNLKKNTFIRCPVQENDEIQKIHRVELQNRSPPSRVIIVKRVGNTTIKSTSSAPIKAWSKAPTKVGVALKAQMTRLQSQALLMKRGTLPTSGKPVTPKDLVQEVKMCLRVKPIDQMSIKGTSKEDASSSTSSNPIDPRDERIRKLEEQNLQMKNMLLKCRKEATMVETKMKCVVKFIDNLLETAKEDNPQTKSKKLPKIRLPCFPIRSIAVLRSFELDMSSKAVYEHVVNRILEQHLAGVTFEKPATLLSGILFTLVTPELLSFFTWNDQWNNAMGQTVADPVPGALGKVLGFHSLKRFVSFNTLFLRLSNVKGYEIFKRSMSAEALEKFVESKVLALRKARYSKQKSERERQEALKQLKTEFDQINKNPSPLPTDIRMDMNNGHNSGESDNEDETEEMIEWLDNNEMFETAMNGKRL